MSEAPFVRPAFEPPSGLSDVRFVLEPLGPQHNDRDDAACTSSIRKNRSTLRRMPELYRAIKPAIKSCLTTPDDVHDDGGTSVLRMQRWR